MNQSLISCDPKVMLGKPIIAGTRITVELILEKLAAGAHRFTVIGPAGVRMRQV